jgi:hypothetical protein
MEKATMTRERQRKTPRAAFWRGCMLERCRRRMGIEATGLVLAGLVVGGWCGRRGERQSGGEGAEDRGWKIGGGEIRG